MSVKLLLCKEIKRPICFDLFVNPPVTACAVPPSLTQGGQGQADRSDLEKYKYYKNFVIFYLQASYSLDIMIENKGR
jgi:hypothetical protein